MGPTFGLDAVAKTKVFPPTGYQTPILYSFCPYIVTTLTELSRLPYVKRTYRSMKLVLEVLTGWRLIFWPPELRHREVW